ncbi:hypothetical protein [Flavobacterium sp.]|uniref:hypothetical protein n=1 Tax=Flavobacterium sp. TaxID=239 RepID=UPI0037510DA2
MFNIRVLTDDDFPALQKWWKWFRFSAPPKDYLPDEGRGGIMVTKNEIDVCAGYLFFTNSKMAWLEFIVSNNEYRDKDRQDAICFLINEATDLARRRGFKVVFTSIKHKSLIKHFLKCGYSIGSENTTELIIKL